MQVQSSYTIDLFVMHQTFVLISYEVFQIFRYLYDISRISTYRSCKTFKLRLFLKDHILFQNIGTLSKTGIFFKMY